MQKVTIELLSFDKKTDDLTCAQNHLGTYDITLNNELGIFILPDISKEDILEANGEEVFEKEGVSYILIHVIEKGVAPDSIGFRVEDVDLTERHIMKALHTNVDRVEFKVGDFNPDNLDAL